MPAEAVEYPQREIVNAIQKSELTPSNGNLGQLYEAMQKVVAGGAYALVPATASVLGGVKVNKGGLQVDSAGLLSLFLLNGGGLGLDSSGRIYVNPDAFSADILKELLKALRLPQWISGNTNFYVRPDGKDSNDGLSNTAAGAFRSIQGALNNIAVNYNIGSYAVIINVGLGVYDEDLLLPYHTKTTGTFQIKSIEGAIVRGAFKTAGPGAGTFYLDGLTIEYAGRNSPGSVSNYYAINCDEGSTIRLTNTMIDLKVGDTSLTKFGVRSSGLVAFFSGCSFAGTCYQFWSLNGGKMTLNNDCTINGTATSLTLSATNLSSFTVSTTANAGVTPVINGTVTGKRYAGATNSIINTLNSGPNYFPGTIAGTVATGAQYS